MEKQLTPKFKLDRVNITNHGITMAEVNSAIEDMVKNVTHEIDEQVQEALNKDADRFYSLMRFLYGREDERVKKLAIGLGY